MNRAKLIFTVIVFGALALLLAACGSSAAKLTDAGNQAYARQAYDEALQAYQEAQSSSPDLAEPYYNSANVLYREGKYEEALKALDQAAQLAQTAQVAQGSHFNAGNAAFEAKSWEAAAESYRQALLRDPADLDAKHNLELVLQQMQKQQDQQKQDQQKQDQQGGQGQQDQQKQDQQGGQGQQDQQLGQQDQQKQDQQDGQGQQDQQQGQQEQQQQGQQDGQGNQDQQKQDQQDGQGQQDQQQGQQQQDQRQGRQPGQSPDQRDQQGQGQAQPGREREGQPPSGSQLAPGERMTQDQARQLLAAIAGKSDTLQGRLGQFLQVRGRPPVQDW
jgi:Ca-activated chloride channel homolog